ncbi:MAG TPA: FAD/NAD(P)-binding protein, partial [Rhizomicrobium sp.]
MKPRTIAICGNGASAALLLLALARFSDRPVKIIVLGVGDRCGAGVAYSTTNASHLLNVPAARMSADLLAPQQFQRWLERRDVRLPTDFATQFVSRSLYADYLDQILKERLPQAAELDVRFVQAEVTGLVRDEAGWRVVHQSGSVFADLVVLATGNDMPAPIAPHYKEIARHIIDIPWGPLPLSPQEDVLILG